MRAKRLALLGLGIMLVGLFAFFSTYPINPGNLPSVHPFAYHCVLETDAYLEGYQYPSEEDAKDDCHYNMRISLLVIGYGVAGIFLIVYSVRRIKKSIK